MLFDLPSDDDLYAALLARDPDFDGRAYVGVASTGVFCRLTCPARKPKRENCTFYETVPACIEAGYRPCKRCKPLGPEAAADPVIAILLPALEAEPERRWTQSDVERLGVNTSTARRVFQRHFGMTFLELARLRRVQASVTTLGGGGSVIEAQLDAGFESGSAFRDAFAKIMGRAPGDFSKDPLLWADWIDTPLGPMIAVADRQAVHLLEFLERKALARELSGLDKMVKGRLGFGRVSPMDHLAQELGGFFAGTHPRFETPVALNGSPFTRDVWRALQDIPAGQTRSYSQIAKTLGRPAATRAVARANGANPLAIIVPCHRVVGTDGSLTGYGGGLWRKQRLIEIERQYAKDVTQ